MSESIVLEITRAEAIVLTEFFARFEKTNQLALFHNAEFVALSSISGQIEKQLPELFASDYDIQLSQAQASVAQGFEGLAPGVEPGGA